MFNVRLTDYEITAIQKAFKKYFSPADRLWLFGSRVNQDAKGGDIDLYVETDLQDADAVVKAKNSFLVALYESIGDQKIDCVVKFENHELPIYEVAREKGVRLV